jgi:C4-dicarboxylate-specific signal transduction histidine kinase
VANAAAAQSIAKKGEDKKAVAQILKEIAEDGNRVGQVIDRLRGLVKKGELQSKPVNLNRLIESTLSLLRSELVNRETKLEMDLKSDLPLISGDSVQVQQVLLNLMTNAIEAMASTPPSERTLSIGTRTEPDGYAEVTITDHGPGMAPDELARLFRPFFTTKERGLGLGLWICSTIVTSHGGRLNLSNTPGGGARAILSLPIAVSNGKRVMTT